MKLIKMLQNKNYKNYIKKYKKICLNLKKVRINKINKNLIVSLNKLKIKIQNKQK